MCEPVYALLEKDEIDELFTLRAMKRRLEAWAVELDVNRETPGDVGKFIAAELRSRMAGRKG